MIGSGLISTSLSPNAEKDDVLVALRLLFQPARWITGSARLAVEKWFARYFDNSRALTFNSGRSALFAVLRAFDIGAGDEVLVQAFTCVAVPNSVIWTGAKPVYVDIDASLNMDPVDAEKKITKRTRVMIIQHTFGTPADMDTLLAVAKKHSLLVIEDCAHSLGATYNGRKVGTLGDASCFSFGRDKVISSVFGGLAVVAKHHDRAWMRLKKLHNDMSYPTGFWVLQQIMHPVAFSFILPLYRLGVGKAILFVLQKSGLLGFPVYPEEKDGRKPSAFPGKYPNGLAMLLLNQLRKLDRFNARSRARSAWYREKLMSVENLTLPATREGSVSLRFPVLVENASSRLLRKAKRHGILLGNWYHNIIDPTGVKFQKISYEKGSCPKAEYAASHIINLPTNISQPDAIRVIKELV